MPRKQREQFIGILGHDLRNPLSSMTMNASLLLLQESSSEKDGTTFKVRLPRRVKM